MRIKDLEKFREPYIKKLLVFFFLYDSNENFRKICFFFKYHLCF